MRSRPRFRGIAAGGALLVLVVLAGNCGKPEVVATNPASKDAGGAGAAGNRPAEPGGGRCGWGRGRWRIRATGRRCRHS